MARSNVVIYNGVDLDEWRPARPQESERLRSLLGIAVTLRIANDYAAIIEGHADEQGTREYNLALGARRAAGRQRR